STRGVASLIIAYAATGWTGMARLVRGQVIQLKEQEFITAAKLMGAKPMRIILKHLLPNTLSVVIVNITLAIPSAIFTEAYLSFIGLGRSEEHTSELQSRFDIVCRLLLEKKSNTYIIRLMSSTKD